MTHLHLAISDFPARVRACMLLVLFAASGALAECFAQEAHDRAVDLLSGGRAWLTFDEECADHYDRTLSYVHVGLGEQYFVQRAMLQGGFATAFAVSPNTTFESDFSEDESLAGAGGVGLWGACAN